MNIGKSIKMVLLDRDMQQSELAEKLGISPQSMSQICSRDYCKKSTLDSICEALEMKPSELIAMGE